MPHLLPGAVVAVLGTQWGDEGKGKLVDILAAEADLCCRFNGGSNAGHTLVVNGKKYAFHLLPCGMLFNQCQNLLGNGVVIHLKTMMNELDSLYGDYPDALDRLKISSRAHLVFDFHRIVDGITELTKAANQSLGRGSIGAIGTTKQGIGPCYASKSNRLGVRVSDLLDLEVFRINYLALFAEYRARFPEELNTFDFEEEINRHVHYGETLKKCIIDSISFLADALESKKKILVEGANAVMLDIDLGTYPFVTSSSTTAGGICTGLGIAPKYIKNTIGVVKAYTTRVGGGPFPSELASETEQCKHMQEVGHEFGTTTGRRRRCGWLDAQLLRYACYINGVDSINLTKLDVLTGIPKLKIAHRYYMKNEAGERIPYAPISYPDNHLAIADVNESNIDYAEFDGWSEDISGCRSFDELPKNCKIYIEAIESYTGVKISSIGVGPDREATIFIEAFDKEDDSRSKRGLCC